MCTQSSENEVIRSQPYQIELVIALVSKRAFSNAFNKVYSILLVFCKLLTNLNGDPLRS